MSHKLTELSIKSWKRDSKKAICDGSNLWLTPKKSGDPTWVVRYRLGGKRREYTLGPHSLFSLSEAREMARDVRRMAKRGQDPVELRRLHRLQQSAAMTYGQLLDDYMAVRGPELSEVTRKEIQRMQRKDVLPLIGLIAIREIAPGHLITLIRQIAARKQSVARRVWEQISVIFAHGVALSQLPRNPCNDLAISAILGRKPKPKPRTKLSRQQLSLVLLRLRDQGPVNEAAIKLLLYSAVRKSELLTAEWINLDLEAGLWHIPADARGNKGRRAYSIPLAPQAISWFRALQACAGDSPYVLPALVRRRDAAVRAKTMAVSTLNVVISRICGNGVPRFDPHDLRSTARSHFGEWEPNQLVVERCLNHALGGLIEVYDRGDYLPERRALLEKWAAYLDDL